MDTYLWAAAKCFAGSLLAIPLVPLAVRRAKWDGEKYTFPQWADWLLTHDAPELPGDAFYEDAIWETYKAKGHAAATRQWLWRNLAHNLWYRHGAHLVPGTRVYRIGAVDPNDDTPVLGVARYRTWRGAWEYYRVGRIWRNLGYRLRFGWKLQPFYKDPQRVDRVAQLSLHVSIRRIGPVA